MPTNSCKNKLKKGYSLATLAVLVAAFSAVTVGLMTHTQYKPAIDKKIADHKNISNTLEYIKNYASKNNVIPCPADPTLPPTHADYLTASGSYPNCSMTLPRKGVRIFKGLVPAKTLGINISNAFDSNHALLTYIISNDTSSLVVANDFNCVTMQGALVSGCSFTNANQFMQFGKDEAPNVAIISHGADQIGAFRKDRTSVTTYSKTTHHIDATLLPNGKRFDSIPQAINSDLYLTGTSNADEIIFKPKIPLGNPSNTSSSSNDIKYDDTVLFAKIPVNLQQAGYLSCWGSATDGGTLPAAYENVLVKQIFGTERVMCALKVNNDVICWGQADYGGSTPSPTIQAKNIISAYYTTCAIKMDDTAQCWGNHASTPSYGGTVPVGLGKVKQLHGNGTAIYGAVCAIKEDDTVQCWGSVQSGGNGPPTTITAKHLSSSTYSFCAIKMDDTVQCWGQGNTGISPTEDPDNPASPAIQAKFITGGIGQQCAIKPDGTVQCWSSLAQLAGIKASNAKAVATPANAACAIIENNNRVLCWGNSSSGGTTPSMNNSNYAELLAARSNGICGLKYDGTINCWGTSNSSISTPPTTFIAKSFVGTSGSTCAIRHDDTVACWGVNTNPNVTDVPNIKAIRLHSNVSATCAILKDE